MNNFSKIKPEIDKTAYISESAKIIGKVVIGKHSSIWYNSVIRADINKIAIGNYTSVQDGCVIHVADEHDTKIGNYTTIGHQANLHGCTIGNNVLVGIGAIILNGAVLKDGCQIAAGSVVTEGSVINGDMLAVGAPAKEVRRLSKKELKKNLGWALKYGKLKEFYKPGFFVRKIRPKENEL